MVPPRPSRRRPHDRGAAPVDPADPLDATALAAVAPLARARGGDLVVRVLVQPGARRPAILGRHGDELRVRVAAPPERGRANAEVVRAVAAALGVATDAVVVGRGASGRHKELVVTDGARPEVVRRLADALDGGAAPG